MAETSETSGENFDVNRFDGVLTNAITGLGTKRDKSAYYGIQGQGHLSEEQLESLYYDPLCRRVVDIFAESSVAKPPTIKFAEEAEGHDETMRQFERYLEETEFFHYIEEALKLQRIYGGAALFLVCDDGMEVTEPLDPSRLRAITDFVPLSKREIKPHDYNYLNYRNPDLYRISTSKSITQQNDLQYMLVHSSRVLRFDGLYLPWKQRLNNDGWGLSFLQPFFEPFKRYRGACDGISTMLNEFDLFVHSLPGLSNKIAAGQQSALKNRMEANALARSIYGGMVLDSEEKVEFLSRSLGGAEDIFDRLLDDLVAAADMPKPLLFGTSPAGGLSESGKYEDKVWAATIERYQNHSMRQPLTRFFDLIFQMRTGPTSGVVPDGEWTVYFPPYFAQSDADRANLRQQVALTDQIYMNAGVVTPMEVRASRFGGTEYNLDTVLHQEEEDRLLAKRELQHEAALQGFEGQRQRLANGSGEKVEEETDFEPTGFNADGQFMQVNGLTLLAGPSNGIYRTAELVHADGQRNDSEPVVLVGERLQDTKLYRGHLKGDDDTIIAGPLLCGFYSSRSAGRALRHYADGEEISGVERLEDLDVRHLKGTYDDYYGDGKAIEYRGMKFPDGYNSPIATPDHPEKSHAVLAKEGSQVKLIRFGQQGVKGSPKKPNESEASRKRREAFRARHAKNIKKGKMSAAYWASRFKW